MKNKQEFFIAETIDIVGKSENSDTYIYKLKDCGVMVRRIYIETRKGGDEIDIVQITDTHLNNLKFKEFKEKRKMTFEKAKKVMELAALFDKVIVTGDVMDGLTWGLLRSVRKVIYDKCPDALLTVGSHDITRVIGNKACNLYSLNARYRMLRTTWRNDVFYHSEVLDRKVMLVLLNNGEHRYYDLQVEKLDADIRKARADGLIILIFQHEQLCTRNPKEKNVKSLWAGAPAGSANFCDDFLGNDSADEVTEKMYRMITSNGDVIKGIFCGHKHNDFYTEIEASYTTDGIKKSTMIPQYVLCGAYHDQGHMMVITVK